MSKQQHGFTLVELIVSMLISLFVVIAAVRLFTASSLSDRLNYQFGVMQESARSALFSISNDARMAGFSGCSDEFDTSNVLMNSNALDQWLVTEAKVQGINQADVVNMVDPAATSEGIIIYKMSADEFFNITSHDEATGSVVFDRPIAADIAADSPVVLVRQDCQQVAIVAASTVASNSLTYATSGGSSFNNCSLSLQGNFTCYSGSVALGTTNFNPGIMSPLDSVVYYLAPDNGVSTLFRKRVGDANGVPVVAGIEDMVVYYGLDTDGDGSSNRFIRAGDRNFRHAHWATVTAIRLHLLTISRIELTPSPRDYFFNGTAITGTDQFLRREYVMSIGIRN